MIVGRKKAGPLALGAIDAGITALLKGRKETGISHVIVIAILDDATSCMASTVMDHGTIQHFLRGEIERLDDPELSKARIVSRGQATTRQ